MDSCGFQNQMNIVNYANFHYIHRGGPLEVKFFFFFFLWFVFLYPYYLCTGHFKNKDII